MLQNKGKTIHTQYILLNLPCLIDIAVCLSLAATFLQSLRFTIVLRLCLDPQVIPELLFFPNVFTQSLIWPLRLPETSKFFKNV